MAGLSTDLHQPQPGDADGGRVELDRGDRQAGHRHDPGPLGEALGGAGADILAGDTGNDVIGGGDGDDRVYGEEGDDTLSGGNQTDTCSGSTGTDTVDLTCETTTGIP